MNHLVAYASRGELAIALETSTGDETRRQHGIVMLRCGADSERAAGVALEPIHHLIAGRAVTKALDRARSWMVVHALGRYMAEHGEGILATARGAAELDRGESEDTDAELDDLDRIIASAEAEAR